MTSAASPNAADFAVVRDLLPFRDTATIPLYFYYGETPVHGIPRDFRCVIKRERVSSQIVRTTVSGIDAKGLEISGEYTQYLDFPVAEWCFSLTNRGKHDTERISDFMLGSAWEGKHPVLQHGNGDDCTENGFRQQTEPLCEAISLSPQGGRPCKGAFPYMRISFDSYAVCMAIGWPAQWQATFVPDRNGVRFAIGQQRFSTVIHPGETMRSPRLTVLGYTGDEQRGVNLWRRWYLLHILPREADGTPVRPRMFVHTFAIDGKEEFTGITEENQKTAIRAYMEKGVKPDGWWVDAGWYPCGGRWPQIGDWCADPSRFPDGLAPVGKMCRENGIDFLLWFEPERCRRGTKLHREHPDWMLFLTDEKGNERENYLLNYADEECVDYMADMLCELIKKYGVTVYRQDFNMDPLPYWEAHEPDDRIGAMENLHVQGYLRLWDMLLERNPGLIIDSCASGGTRNDLETMRRSVPLQYTDIGLGNHPLKFRQYRRMNAWLPYYRSHTISWDGPDGNYSPDNHHPLDKFAYMTAVAPAITSMLTWDDTPEAFSITKKMEPVWRKAASLMLESDYYPLNEETTDADWYACQFDCPEKQCGFIQVLRTANGSTGSLRVMPYHAQDCTYKMVQALTGETVVLSPLQMQKGMTFRLHTRTGEIWFYEYK